MKETLKQNSKLVVQQLSVAVNLDFISQIKRKVISDSVQQRNQILLETPVLRVKRRTPCPSVTSQVASDLTIMFQLLRRAVVEAQIQFSMEFKV